MIPIATGRFVTTRVMLIQYQKEHNDNLEKESNNQKIAR